MVNQEQMVNGILRYIDMEVMPMLNTPGKWMVGTYAVMVRNNAQHALHDLMENPAIKMTGAVDEGMIDIDMVANALEENANKYGKLVINLPIVGEMGFNTNDVNLLRMYIRGDR